MKVRALKDFPYSHTGAETRPVLEGEEFDCRPDLVEGLVSEGYIGRAGSAAAKAHDPGAVEIPPNWLDLHIFKRRSLAAKIAGKGKLGRGDDADAIIGDEQRRRIAG